MQASAGNDAKTEGVDMKKWIGVILLAAATVIPARAQDSAISTVDLATPARCLAGTSLYCNSIQVQVNGGPGTLTFSVNSSGVGYVALQTYQVSPLGAFDWQYVFYGTITKYQVTSTGANANQVTGATISFSAPGADSDGDTDTITGTVNLTFYWALFPVPGGRGTYQKRLLPVVSGLNGTYTDN